MSTYCSPGIGFIDGYLKFPGSLLRLLDWLPPFVVATGFAGWVSDDVPAAFGIGLIVVGSVVSGLVRKPVKTKA